MKSLKTLIVEDSENDEQLLLRQLAKAGYDVQSTRAQTAAEVENALAECEWDVILSDYVMPGFNGLDALSILRQSGLDIPFIIVSGTIGEDVAVEAMRVGVDDYLMKDNLTRLAPAIERELENAASRRRQKQAEEALRQSEASLAVAQRIAQIGSWDWDVPNNQVSWSEETYRTFARTKNQFKGTFEAFLDMVHPEDRQRVQSAVDEALSHATSFAVEHRIIRPDGEERVVCEIGEVTFDESGNALRFIGTVQDITERKLAEEALHEAAKRERAMIKNALDVICTIDAEGRFTSVSPASLNVWGYAPAELIGQRYIELVALEDVAKTNKAALNIMSGIKARDFENRYRHKNGSLIHIRWSALWSEKDQLMFCVAHDITERRAAETEMRLMKRAIDSIVEGVLICDAQQPDNPTIYANAAFENLTGYTFEEIVGRNCRILQGADTNRQTVDEIKESLQRGKPFRGEILNYCKNGAPFWNDLHISPISDNSGQVANFVAIQQDITERKNTENALHEAEQKYESLFANAVTGIYQTTIDGRYITANPMLARMFGYDSPEEMINQVTGEQALERRFYVEQGRREEFARLIRVHGVLTGFESEIYRRDGDRMWISEHALATRDEFGQVTGYQGTTIDITATKELEQQLRQAQKLESVGLLAGGIAHDFNNMLTAINGYSDLTLRQLKADDPLRRNIEEIKKAGLRSAALTQQLLAFSRQQVLQPEVTNLNEIITETTKMLQRLIGEDIQITTMLNLKAGRVKVDPGQFSQIIINLAVNARDAMPQGGKVTIETANIFLDPGYTEQHIGVLPGAYVMLAVSDTGIGMSDELKQHIFEPFFTTKEVGQGTGLGLATVYGIVKQSGGSIEVYSEEGLGTTFKIYLPRVAEQVDETSVTDTRVEIPQGTETILLVEDEEMVRNLSKEILKECGYTVIEARNGLEALKICDEGGCKFDLLMTDVVMPQMGGRELAEKLTAKAPNMRVLFTSGYTDDAVVRHGIIETNTNFIQKPFTMETLAGKVRRILDNPHKDHQP